MGELKEFKVRMASPVYTIEVGASDKTLKLGIFTEKSHISDNSVKLSALLLKYQVKQDILLPGDFVGIESMNQLAIKLDYNAFWQILRKNTVSSEGVFFILFIRRILCIQFF